MKTAMIVGTLLMAGLLGLAAEPVAAQDPVGYVKENTDPDCASVGTGGVIVECYGVCLKVIINGYGWCRA